jgi:hypothetical protein
VEDAKKFLHGIEVLYASNPNFRSDISEGNFSRGGAAMTAARQ